MKFQGAFIKEKGVTFTIIVVKSSVLSNQSVEKSAEQSYNPFFPGTPIIIMAQNSRGVPTYSGRKAIVNFLVNIQISQIPWKEYSTNL